MEKFFGEEGPLLDALAEHDRTGKLPTDNPREDKKRRKG